MQVKAVDGGGHVNKDGYGLGFTHLQKGGWDFYGSFYSLNGAVGHEGGSLGYSAAFYCVEKERGGYGYILLTNLNHIEKGVDYSWYFPVFYNINVQLMEHAEQMYEHKHGQ